MLTSIEDGENKSIILNNDYKIQTLRTCLVASFKNCFLDLKTKCGASKFQLCKLVWLGVF